MEAKKLPRVTRILGVPIFAITGNHDRGFADSSTARWKVVYGHYPIYSGAGHGDTPGYDKTLLPILKNRANAYICGHEHTMQHLGPIDGVHLIVNGTGGQGIRPAQSGSRTRYAGSFYGFTVLETGPNGLTMSFVDAEGKVRYQAVLAK